MTHQTGNTDTDRILGTRDDTIVTLRIVLEAEYQSGKHLRIHHHTVMPAGKTPHDQNVAGHSNRLQKLFFFIMIFIDNQSADSHPHLANRDPFCLLHK